MELYRRAQEQTVIIRSMLSKLKLWQGAKSASQLTNKRK
jgi:hypothetical protein